MGGEYFFVDDRAGHHQINVQPKCGRLVTFQSSELHGVQSLLSGSRHGIAIWFTVLDDHSVDLMPHWDSLLQHIKERA